MTDVLTPIDTTTERARSTRDRAVQQLRSLQLPSGAWKGELQTNVTMDAEDMMLRVFLRIDTEQTREYTARWIRSQQRDDGTWATYAGGPGDLSTTVEAWIALRMAGDKPAAPHMRRAAEFVLDAGGLEATRVFTRIWCALFGWWDWRDLPNLPPEMMFLGKRIPLNIYDFGCWARQTIVPLTIVATLRPYRDPGFDLTELRSGTLRRTRHRAQTVPGMFQRLDTVLHRYAGHPIAPLRRAALRSATEWILARQESDGGWGGIQPPWVYSILALHAQGYSLQHPAMRAAIAGLEGFIISQDTPDGPVRRLEACQSPVWDTGLALNALLDAGADPRDPVVRRAADWLVGEQITVAGDWAKRRPGIPAGGWAFEYANDGYPDTDDSAIIVMGLRRVLSTTPILVKRAVDRGIAWTAGMQSADGGWGAFDADNTSTLPAQLPFCDFGAVTDPPSADVTAHVVEMLAVDGRGRGARCKRGVQWLLEHQEADGSWFGRWGAHHIYGTGAVLPALVAAGVPIEDPAIRSAIRWVRRMQNADGGWGEDLRSYHDPSWIGRGESTPSQTAWAMMALVAGGELGEPLRRAIDYLHRTQNEQGTWAEEKFTATGFPGDFYISYHLYRLIFPVWALGRAVTALELQELDEPDEPAHDDDRAMA